MQLAKQLSKIDEFLWNQRQLFILPRNTAANVQPDRPAARRGRPFQRAEREVAPGDRREAVRQRPEIGARAQQRAASRFWARIRSTASITTSARRRCRTSWCSASPTASSSRSGTATTSITCRSPSPRPSASRRAASYYDAAGALRDMVPEPPVPAADARSAMEPPTASTPSGPQREGEGAGGGAPLRRRRCAVATSCARSTAPGRSRASRCPPIAKEPTCAPHSTTETYVALKLIIDNWRWAGVPFYLRTGKSAAAAAHRDRDPVQAGAALAVPRHAGRAAGAQRPHAAHPARRRHDAAIRRQDPGARHGRSAR